MTHIIIEWKRYMIQLCIGFQVLMVHSISARQLVRRGPFRMHPHDANSSGCYPRSLLVFVGALALQEGAVHAMVTVYISLCIMYICDIRHFVTIDVFGVL
jgi:hypothetical protein